MSSVAEHTFSEQVCHDVRSVSDHLQRRLAALKKAASLLKSGESKLAKQEWPMKDLRKLVADLAKIERDAGDSDVTALLRTLEGHLASGTAAVENATRREIAARADAANLEFGTVNGALFIGPFGLSLDFQKQAASLSYAKVPVAAALPLSSTQIVKEAAAQAASLLAPPADFKELAAEFEEAVNVALVRDRKPLQAAELRAPLPEAYREMVLIRQDRSRPASSKSFKDYPLPRFIVELKQLVQSEANASNPKRFRLETAVIENTRNLKKSLFVPNDLDRGYAEGMYFQAIVLVHEG